MHRIEKAASGEDPLDRLRRVLWLYGPTGRATGWRIWIDAWAVAQREPQLRKVLQRLDHQWQDILRGVVDDGVASASSPARARGDGGSALGARRRTLGRRVVHRSVTREQLRSWVAVPARGRARRGRGDPRLSPSRAASTPLRRPRRSAPGRSATCGSAVTPAVLTDR